MNKRTVAIAAVVAIAALAAVPFVYAQGMHRHAAGAAGFPLLFGRLEHARQALDLTDQQVDQLKAIALDLHTRNAPYRDQMRGGFQAAAQILIADPANVAGAQAILDQQAAAQKATRANMLSAASKALSVLTPEQRGKVAQFVTERAARRASR